MILTRKMFRELWQSKGQAFAIAAVVASGVAVFVMSLGTLGFLRGTRDAYYDRYRLGDAFANLTRAPLTVLPQLDAIPGVGTVQMRIVSDVTLDVPGLDEPATGRLISIPENREPRLNAVFLRSGRLPNPNRPDEVLASEAFFLANEMQLGAEVAAVLNGRQQRLRIVGVALSPEYVFQIRAGELLPDEQRFGVFWMNHRQMEAAFDMKGAFNDLSLRLLRGARLRQVLDDVDRILKPYGCAGSYGREDQISAAFLDSEIEQLKGMAVVAPVIFLGVAMFLLHVVLARRIATEREVIATLKAFGFSNSRIAWHYLQSALMITLAGAVCGAAGGVVLSGGLAKMYAQFYRFPEFVFRPDYRVVVFGIAISVVAAVAGCYQSVRAAMKLMPAEAMRPASPSRYRPTLIEWLGLSWLVPLTGRMILRQLSRRPFGAFFSVLGIAASVAVILMGNFSPDAIEYLLDFQFNTAQRHDVQVVFEQPASPDALHDLKHLPGVQSVEPFRIVGVELRSEHHQERASVTGLGQRRDLYRLLDADGQPIRIPPAGIVLSDTLAKRLNVRAGGSVTIEVLEGKRETYQLQVVGLSREYSGMNAYADINFLHRTLQEGHVLSGAYLAVDSRHKTQLYRELKHTPRVAAVAVKDKMIEKFKETVSENLLKFQSFNIFFAAVIAIGVVYNTARISLDERSRELSTMRVIGFSRSEVSAILLGELALLTLLAIPIGWAIGYSFCYAMVQGFESEQFRIPMYIRPRSFALAALVTILASGGSALMVRRRLNNLDLVEVLKSRE